MASINPDDTTEPIESVQSSEVPQGNQDSKVPFKVGKVIPRVGSLNEPDFLMSGDNSQDTEGVKALGRKADNLVETVTSMATYMAYWMCKDTNATTATVSVEGATYKGVKFGDYKVTIERTDLVATDSEEI
jgi:hypothetical protein